ncbi:AbrB family transcriptional regulator [Kineococcus gynurae]|uniref:AbrB family transcriptional regulator n=1 Tax=Kineococcus gynurae TaxID=452979 RepID=A0ABV5LRF5_9ACTN
MTSRAGRVLRARGPSALVVVVAVVGVTVGLDRLGVASPALFAGLLVGLVDALLRPAPLTVPRPLAQAAQGVVGVSVGVLVQLSTFAAVGAHWLSVVLVVLGTLALSLLTGRLLGRHPAVDPVTATMALIAGGAAGLTVMARELGADDRVVGVVQYLRVLLVVGTLPLVLQWGFGVRAEPLDVAGLAGSGVTGVLLGLLALGLGIPLGRLLRLPAAALLGPLLLSGVASATGLLGPDRLDVTVPGWFTSLGFGLAGLAVGSRFTRARVRALGRILPAALGLILAGMAGCAAMAWGLSAATGIAGLDAYLATTPGGLWAVAAAAVGTGADATFVVAVQTLRLLLMLAAAPLVARLLRRGVSGG